MAENGFSAPKYPKSRPSKRFNPLRRRVSVYAAVQFLCRLELVAMHEESYYYDPTPMSPGATTGRGHGPQSLLSSIDYNLGGARSPRSPPSNVRESARARLFQPMPQHTQRSTPRGFPPSSDVCSLNVSSNTVTPPYPPRRALSPVSNDTPINHSGLLAGPMPTGPWHSFNVAPVPTLMGQQSRRPLVPTTGRRYNTPPPSPVRFTPLALRQPPPVPPRRFYDHVARPQSRVPTISAAGPVTRPSVAQPEDGTPDAQASVLTHNDSGYAPRPLDAALSADSDSPPPGRLTRTPTPGPARCVSPIGYAMDLVMFLSPERLEEEFAAGPRFELPWKNWESEFVLKTISGRDAPPSRIRIATYTSDKTSASEIYKVDEFWHYLSAITFRGIRDIPGLIRQWRVLLGIYLEILRFAEAFGLEVRSPQYEGGEPLVEHVITLWKTHVPSGVWGVLSQADMAAWTYDPREGWLACVHKRMMLPTRPDNGSDTAPPGGSDPQFNHVGPARSHRPGPPDQSPKHVQSTRSPYSHDPLATDDTGLVLQTYASAQDPAHKRAIIDYVASRTLRTRISAVGQMAGIERTERMLRLKIASEFLASADTTPEVRKQIQAWILKSFFSSHPANDFAESLSLWQEELGIGPTAGSQVQTSPTALLDSLDLLGSSNAQPLPLARSMPAVPSTQSH